MSDQSSGNSLIVASVVLAAAILAGSWMLKQSIDAGAAQLAVTSAKLQAALDRPSPAPAPRAAARPGRPDPTKKYDINIGGAPTGFGLKAGATMSGRTTKSPSTKKERPTISWCELM